jgi:hypothetical protein
MVVILAIVVLQMFTNIDIFGSVIIQNARALESGISVFYRFGFLLANGAG